MIYDPDEHIEFGSMRELVANGIRKDYEKSDAWKQGYQAFNTGKFQNPYHSTTNEWDDWNKGFETARAVITIRNQ